MYGQPFSLGSLDEISVAPTFWGCGQLMKFLAKRLLRKES